MTKFILNNQLVSTPLPTGTLVLDFVRYHRHLHGTKIGCREGDCGACTVLVGDWIDGKVHYRSATSCLLALGNVHGKHVVTIEGTNINGLNFMQQAFTNEGASQCGFCTPGFMVSLAGLCLQPETPHLQAGIDAVNGNICRCTGYKSIERAIATIVNKLNTRLAEEDVVDFAIANGMLPAYFKEIPQQLQTLLEALPPAPPTENIAATVVGGGTDLYVQQHDTMTQRNNLQFTRSQHRFNAIDQVNDLCFVGGSATVTDIAISPIFNNHIAHWQSIIKLVSSTPIRNMATLAGNFVNASPIGDFSILFLALDAQLQLTTYQQNEPQSRILPLRKLYLGYKQLAKKPEELVERIFFKIPDVHTHVSFEKVCKRTHLDIASVNTALCVQLNEDGVIVKAGLAAGGVAPIPAYLPVTSRLMEGKKPDAALLKAVCESAQQEVRPISDVRGSVAYKRLLLQQLITAHFVKLFGEVLAAAI